MKSLKEILDEITNAYDSLLLVIDVLDKMGLDATSKITRIANRTKSVKARMDRYHNNAEGWKKYRACNQNAPLFSKLQFYAEEMNNKSFYIWLALKDLVEDSEEKFKPKPCADKDFNPPESTS